MNRLAKLQVRLAPNKSKRTQWLNPYFLDGSLIF